MMIGQKFTSPRYAGDLRESHEFYNNNTQKISLNDVTFLNEGLMFLLEEKILTRILHFARYANVVSLSDYFKLSHVTRFEGVIT